MQYAIEIPVIARYRDNHDEIQQFLVDNNMISWAYQFDDVKDKFLLVFQKEEDRNLFQVTYPDIGKALDLPVK